MNVAHLLRARADERGHAAALLDGSGGVDRALTFAELERAASGAATQLRAAGLQPGDGVLVLVPMSLELYVALNAIFRLGLVALFLDPSAGREHIESCCALHPPRAFIGSPRAQWLRLVVPALRRIPVKFTTGTAGWGVRRLLGVPRNGASEPVEPCPPEAPALLRFTSGTTGTPKAAVRTHGFLAEQQRVLAKSLELVPGEIDLATLPVFVLANLAAGVTSVIPNADLRAPGEVDPAPVLRQIQRHRPQRVSASPAFLERLAEGCDGRTQSLECLRKVFTGGGPVFPHLLDKLHALAPRAEVAAVYGSTEAEPIAQIMRGAISEADRQAMWNGRGLLAGLPDAAITLRILREHESGCGGGVPTMTELEFAALGQRPGEVGQVVVSGPHVQPGYLNGVGDDETKLRVNGTAWHRTGDAGYLDERGRLWLLGRCGGRIQDERGTLYPFQVECAAYREPDVRRAALVSHRGQRFLAVEPRRGRVPDLATLRASLAWANLDRIRLLDRLPVDKRHNAKVDLDRLKTLL